MRLSVTRASAPRAGLHELGGVGLGREHDVAAHEPALLDQLHRERQPRRATGTTSRRARRRESCSACRCRSSVSDERRAALLVVARLALDRADRRRATPAASPSPRSCRGCRCAACGEPAEVFGLREHEPVSSTATATRACRRGTACRCACRACRPCVVDHVTGASGFARKSRICGARQLRVRDERRRRRIARARRRDHERVELVGDRRVARAEQRAVVGHRLEQLLGRLGPLGVAQPIESDQRGDLMTGREVREQVGRGARGGRCAVDGGLIVHARRARAGAGRSRRRRSPRRSGREPEPEPRRRILATPTASHRAALRSRRHRSRRHHAAASSPRRPACAASAPHRRRHLRRRRVRLRFGAAHRRIDRRVDRRPHRSARPRYASGRSWRRGLVGAAAAVGASGGLATSAGSASAFGGGGASSMSTSSDLDALSARRATTSATSTTCSTQQTPRARAPSAVENGRSGSMGVVTISRRATPAQ